MIKILNDKNIKSKLICMVRNRPAGFIYTEEEFSAMKEELDILLDENVDGIAFGFLTSNYEIDVKRTKFFVNKIHLRGKEAVFHRAFDNTKYYKKSLKILIKLKVDRVITSGQCNSAIEGKDILRDLLK